MLDNYYMHKLKIMFLQGLDKVMLTASCEYYT